MSETVVSVDAAALKAALSSAIKIRKADKTTNGPQLPVQFLPEGDVLRVVATDRYIIALFELDAQVPDWSDGPLDWHLTDVQLAQVLPVVTAAGVRGRVAFTLEGAELTIQGGSSQVRLTLESVELPPVLRLLDAPFEPAIALHGVKVQTHALAMACASAAKVQALVAHRPAARSVDVQTAEASAPCLLVARDVALKGVRALRMLVTPTQKAGYQGSTVNGLRG